MAVLVTAPVVAAQRRHRAVEGDRRGEQLAAGEDVAHLPDGDALGAQHGVRLEDLDGDALGLERRLNTAQEKGHAVPAEVGVLLEGGAGRLVDDLAEPLGEGRTVRLLEADPQELLPGPLPQALRQPGQPLGGPEGGQGGLDQAAQPVDDGLAVALQLRQLVRQDAEPGAKAAAQRSACSGRADAGSSLICWRAGVRTCS